MNRIIRLSLPLLLLAIVVGCASSKKPSVVTGKVTYNGTLVKGGTLSFHRTAEELAGGVGADIKEDGTYSVSGVPPGDVIVTVDTDMLNPDRVRTKGRQKGEGGKNVRGDYRAKMQEQGNASAGQTQEADASRYTKIPSKYGDKKTSTLKTTVKAGTSTTFNIEMTD